MSLFKASRSSILVNGSPPFEFQCFKGVRQGDPLSQFLSLIGMEVFSHLMSKMVSNGLFRGFLAPNGSPSISHLLYADDAILIGEWSELNLLNIRKLLWCFNIISGLNINFTKSILYDINIPTDIIEAAATSLNYTSNTLPFKYLGLVVGTNMNRINNRSLVVDVFDHRLAKWRERTLSNGGRLTLLKSVLEVILTYFFSLYEAPQKLNDILEAKRRNFFWVGNTDSAGIPWAAWEQITKPKKDGG